MVTEYIILADSSAGFKIPRQLSEICGEPIIKRTVRLLKENGIEDIIITSHDKRFNNLGAKRYEPKYNDWNAENKTGYWLSAFPIELINQPICFLFGDVYYSEKAIKTIVETDTNSTKFFCAYNNTDKYYIKHHDEPLAYKIVDYELFKKHINLVKKLKDEGKCCREPIVWEVYRSIHGQDINTHIMTTDYIAINDESCDIDTNDDIIKLNKVIGGMKMIKCEAIKQFTLERFDELRNIKRNSIDKKGTLYIGDTFECDEELANYLMGNNTKGEKVVRIIEVEPKKETITVKNITLGDGNVKNSSYTVMAKKTVKRSKSKK